MKQNSENAGKRRGGAPWKIFTSWKSISL